MKILIVEDETKLAETLAEGLKLKGYITDIISDGKIAETRIVNRPKDYDLILLDLMLPTMDGETICKNIRALNITVPVLILTARDEIEVKVKLLLSGADDYLVKPFSFDELLARITALSRSPEPTHQPLLSHSG
jgi:DNA-binding response OmpR family regulator